MATGPATQLADVIVPEIFDPYMQNLTEEKTRIIQAGAVVSDADLLSKLQGGGLTFQTPSWKDLDNEAENIMTDDADDVYGSPPYTASNNSVPKKIESLKEISVRLSRHQSWSSVELAAVLAGAEPMAAIANLVSGYWARRRQAAFIALMNGVIADNEAAPVGSEHVQGDLTYDVAPGSTTFQQGITEFSTKNFLRAALTMGDSQEDLGMVMMHSLVYHKALLQNLIEFIPDSINGQAVEIPTFLGRTVIVDDGMPNDGQVFDTWLFGAGFCRFASSAPSKPSEMERAPRAGGGAGQDILHTRVHWCFHPVGFRYNGTAPNGGPSNASTANNLANAGSWFRVYPERKQIKFARLRTIEVA